MALTSYDDGYASVDRHAVVGLNDIFVAADAPVWGVHTVRLHLSWLSAQLQSSPEDHFTWGRYDALCDCLVSLGPVGPRLADSLAVLAAISGPHTKIR